MVMKNYLKFLVLLLIGNVLVSCNDEFTEEDAMDALQVITLQIGVRDAGNSYTAVSGAEVKAVVDAESVTATTDTNGIAVFENVSVGGYVNVYVTKDDYTTVYEQVNTTPDDYRQTVVSEDIYMYSLSSDNMAVVEGKLTIETDLTNRERETLSGVEVLAYNDNLSGVTQYFVGETDASGNYSINVPVNSVGSDNIQVYFPTVEQERTYGKVADSIYSLASETFFYSPWDSASSIEQVPSALIEIAAPSVSGSGFELGLKAVRNLLSNAVDNKGADEAIVDGGSGYTKGQSFTFAADDDGNKAELVINSVDDDGVISSVSFTNNGAKYSSMPDIISNPTNGSGAEFDLRFRYKYRVYISNSGSDYLYLPTVGVTYSTAINGTSKLLQLYEEDITDYNPLGGGPLYDNAFISNGAIIVKDETDGDTLFTTGYVYAEPEFTYSEEESQQSVWYATTSAISKTDSTLNDDFTAITEGEGYDYSNPPEVTITALAGYGSGASVKAVVYPDGIVYDLVVMEKGSGYTQDINDYDGDGVYEEKEDGTFTGFTGWTTSYGYHSNVKPGMTYVGNVFYGTGTEE